MKKNPVKAIGFEGTKLRIFGERALVKGKKLEKHDETEKAWVVFSGGRVARPSYGQRGKRCSRERTIRTGKRGISEVCLKGESIGRPPNGESLGGEYLGGILSRDKLSTRKRSSYSTGGA